MTAAAPQITLDGHVVLSLRDLKEAVREVLQEEGILKVAKAAKWSRDYKGDEVWLEVRGRVLDLIKTNILVTFKTLDQDPDIREIANINTYMQFWRAVDQHLVPNKPQGPGVIVTFSLLGGKRRFVTIGGYRHCAIKKAAEKKHDKRIEEQTLEAYGVIDCILCGYILKKGLN